MEHQTLAEPQQAIQAAQAVARIVSDDWPEGQSKKLPALLLCALCRLAEHGAKNPGDGWEPPDIGEVMTELGAHWNGLTVAKRINQHWKVLERLWKARHAELSQRLAGDGIFVEPALDKPQSVGGRGNQARYRLRFFAPRGALSSAGAGEREPPVPSIAPNESDQEAALKQPGQPLSQTLPTRPVQTIVYYPVNIALPPLLRWIPANGLGMGGWVGKVLAVSLTVLAVLLVFIALAGFFLLQYTPSVVAYLRLATGVATLLAMAWLGFGWWWTLIDNRVARAPMWWQSIALYGDNVIEHRLDPSGATPPRLHLVRYVADCPLCGADGPGRSAVRLASGRIEFYGRIIGRCRHAPNEHVWSFDHITRRGQFLR